MALTFSAGELIAWLKEIPSDYQMYMYAETGKPGEAVLMPVDSSIKAPIDVKLVGIKPCKSEDWGIKCESKWLSSRGWKDFECKSCEWGRSVEKIEWMSTAYSSPDDWETVLVTVENLYGFDDIVKEVLVAEYNEYSYKLFRDGDYELVIGGRQPHTRVTAWAHLPATYKNGFGNDESQNKKERER